MSDGSAIEWTDTTWNPVRGCRRVSPGCEHCYAERMSGRFSKPGEWGHGLVKFTPKGARWTGEFRTVPEKLDEPLRWRKPRSVFVNSMSDLFGEGVSDAFIAAVFAVMAATPQHTYQILTKRPARMLEWFQRWTRIWPESPSQGVWDTAAAHYITGKLYDKVHDAWPPEHPWPLPNVMIGVSCEDQPRADERILLLLQCPAAFYFVSLEPLLGPIDLRRTMLTMERPGACRCGHGHGFTRCPNYGGVAKSCHHRGCECSGFRPAKWLDWVITGAESGPGARPAELDWFRSLRDQCVSSGVPFFLKQADVCLACTGRGNLLVLGSNLLRMVCGACNGTGRAGKVRKGCPALDGKVWDQMPEVRHA